MKHDFPNQKAAGTEETPTALTSEHESAQNLPLVLPGPENKAQAYQHGSRGPGAPNSNLLFI